MDREFLSIANEIRKRLSDDYTKIERISQKIVQNIIAIFSRQIV